MKIVKSGSFPPDAARALEHVTTISVFSFNTGGLDVFLCQNVVHACVLLDPTSVSGT